ncbi:hypothetical protein TNCV_3140031 [Trichonephila clavipes]|nr:hypothetical protein TNCV_3140031 [Trichonephila clavipes]
MFLLRCITPHFLIHVLRHLNVTFGQRWIGHDYQFIGQPDHRTYHAWTSSWVTEISFVPSVEDLVARISVASGRIRDTPGTLQNLRNSIQQLCQACQMTPGRSLEHLLPDHLSIKCFLSHQCVEHSSKTGTLGIFFLHHENPPTWPGSSLRRQAYKASDKPPSLSIRLEAKKKKN